MIKILSIDGGGTRGILPATVLAQVEEEMQKTTPGFRLRDAFDIITGTSTGGMIALSAAAGVPMQQLSDIYLNDSKEIFHDTIWDNIKDLGSAIGAKYTQKNLKKLLEDESLFGKLTLSDIKKYSKNGKGVTVIVPSFDLSPEPKGPNRNFRPRVYNSFYDRDGVETLVNVALRTTAAPTFFPIFEKKYIDGGVAMNNPSMAAIAFAMNKKDGTNDIYGGSNKKKKGLAVKQEDVLLLSLGTGTSGNERIEPEKVGKGDWGAAQWVTHLAELLTTSNMRASEYYAESVVAEENYFRHQFDLKEIKPNGAVALDCTDTKELRAMINLALRDFESNKTRIMDFVQR